MKVVITSGKRKTAIARCYIRSGKGRVKINNIPVEIWEPEVARLKMSIPLQIVGEKRLKNVDIAVKVHGGGVISQADAVMAAIAKGLVQYFNDEELKQKYLLYDRSMIVNDPRRKEAKHPMGRGARKKRQKSFR